MCIQIDNTLYLLVTILLQYIIKRHWIYTSLRDLNYRVHSLNYFNLKKKCTNYRSGYTRIDNCLKGGSVGRA